MSTTNFPTYVKVGGRWRMPERPRMDSHLVWDPATERLVVKEFRLVHQGDLVAVATAEDGSEGVLVWDRGFLGEVDDTHVAEAFAFMSSEVSREKPVNYEAIFREFVKNRGPQGYILWVIGPALVHARGRIAMEWLIHNGYCHGLITGNAVGVHDVEAALYGTTLGMLADGSGTAGGHATHMRAINEVKKAGSIAALVGAGRLQGGIMHALTVNKIPYVLAGSIRDDGPLPETIPSALDSQEAMRELTVKATMVVMVATALHAIAVGNMLPTFCLRPDGTMDEITTICVDQTEFVVGKLKDRGTHQAFGVVTNAQDFMRLVQLELMERG
jgi:lysine-ketoglutarate reductase/saccharopine dehydrogenase-like protein (TIGR00300 family)